MPVFSTAILGSLVMQLSVEGREKRVWLSTEITMVPPSLVGALDIHFERYEEERAVRNVET